MKKTIEELVKERLAPNQKVITFGRVFGSYVQEEEEYLELCKSFNRAKDGDGSGGSTEFKKDRFITFVASDETTDSYGDILRVDGCDLSRFKNRACAFICSHEVGNIHGASGVIVKSWKAKNVEGSPNGKAVMVTVYFPTFEEDPDADYVFKKFKAMTLNAVSVGISVSEYNCPTSDDERKALGLGKYGAEILKWMPHELSAVTVGANPKALMQRSISEEIKIAVREYLDEEAEKAQPTSLSKYLENHKIEIKN